MMSLLMSVYLVFFSLLAITLSEEPSQPNCDNLTGGLDSEYNLVVTLDDPRCYTVISDSQCELYQATQDTYLELQSVVNEYGVVSPEFLEVGTLFESYLSKIDDSQIDPDRLLAIVDECESRLPH